jgi:hypothetical protein
MEGHGQGQRERTSSRRRQRRKSKAPRSKVVIEPELIAARRPDSPLLKNGFHNVVASASPKHSQRIVTLSSALPAAAAADARALDDTSVTAFVSNGSAALNGVVHTVDAGSDTGEANAGSQDEKTAVRRRAVRIVKAADSATGPGNREQQLLDRLMRSQGRGAISRAANDLWESKFTVPKRQEIQIQLLEHENEHRARDAVFAMAELLQREAPIKRPVLDQRLRRLEEWAEDPITRDAAGALRRSMRVHYGP